MMSVDKYSNGLIIYYMYATIAMLCWSFSFIWTSIALKSFPPLTLISFRLAFASVLLFLFLKLTGQFQTIDRSDIKYFFLLAFFQPFLYYVGETYGLTLVNPTLAAVIISTIPVFAPIFAFVILRERFTLVNVIGISISIIGVYVIVSRVNGASTTSWLGIGLILLAVVSAIFYGLLLRTIPSKYSSSSIIFYQSLIGLVFFIPATLILDSPNYHAIIILSESIKALVLLTVFASVLAFVLFAQVVRRMGVAKSQVFTNLIPVFTALISWIIFHQNMILIQWFGVFLVVLGVFVSQRQQRFRKRQIN